MSKRAATKASAFRAELPDGTRIERAFSVILAPDGSETRAGRGNWQWTVYDPDRRPARKRVNLHTKDKGAATGKALALARRFALSTFDPWTSADAGGGSAFAEAALAYLGAKAQSASPTTISGDRGHLARLARLLPAGTDVRHVEAAHVEAFVNAPKRKKKDGTGGGPASAETKKRRRATVQHFFGWAVEAGLSPVNRLTPAAIVTLLDAMHRHPDAATRRAFFNSLAVGGQTGTLERRYRGGLARGNVHAKTGYISGARTLSGYVTASNGHLIAFSLLCNNYGTSTARVNDAQDAIVEALAGWR